MDTVKTRSLPFSKRGFNFETIMWFFTRLTVLAMYGFILAGLTGGLILSARTGANLADVLRWAFFPNLNENPLGAYIWITVLTKLMVVAFILVVSGHGVHGVLEILDDYFTGALARRWFRNGIIAYAIAVNVIAIFEIWIS